MELFLLISLIATCFLAWRALHPPVIRPIIHVHIWYTKDDRISEGEEWKQGLPEEEEDSDL